MSTFVDRYGPWAIVAGASEGLGAAFAKALARRGAHVVLVARRAEAMAQIKQEIADISAVEVRTIALDLANPDAAAQLHEATAALDVGLVVYNAAFSPLGPMLELSLEDQLRAVDVNVRGPLSMAHCFGRRLVARARGGLVLLSSMTAFQGSPFLSTYGATKSFNLSLAEGLWYELAPQGVDVLAVCAGATRTPGYLRRSSGAPGELSPEQVAEESLESLRDGPLLIPGRFNRFASLLLRKLLPRRAAIRIMGAQAKRLTP
jgi:short-subunit dehydrogenase